jgi:2-(1,2-epoxy-1,2-dihydrophenyl)acetyl-CoA isomerase
VTPDSTDADAPEDDLLTELDEHGVFWITLNRPDAANSITPIQRNTIIELLKTASADLHVRCVVIGATGTRFCTGADLRAVQPPGPARPEDAPDRATGDVMRMIQTGAQSLVGGIIDCEKPVIASVNGTAAGVGAHIALAADLVIAADTAKFIEVFVRRGIAPDAGGAWLLPRIVGLHKAKELIFFGEDLSAADALELGIDNKLVPYDDLQEATAAWATKLAAGPTKAIGLSKALVNRSFETDRAAAFAEEAMVQELIMTTEDANEGVAAFRERRDVAFKGW